MNIVIATGGTAGHLFPAIETAKELKNQKHNVSIYGSFGTAKDQILAQGFDVYEHGGQGVVGKKAFALIVSLFEMIKAGAWNIKQLKKARPDVVAGFGGYGAFPTVFAAHILGIPTVIHEQNVVPGKANMWLSKKARKILLSFDESKKYFRHKQMILTGYPSRLKKTKESHAHILKEFHLSDNLPTIFIFGGSQGSEKINDIAVDVMASICRKDKIQVIHITGNRHLESVKKKYASLNICAAVFSFLEKMEWAYAVSDLVIVRAGAGTVTEVAQFNIPAVFIPYPYAGGHQRENAKVLCNKGLSKIIDENELTIELLEGEVQRLLKLIRENHTEGENCDNIYITDAVNRICKEICQLYHE